MWKAPHELALRLIIAVMLMIPGAMAMAKSVKLEPLDREGKRSWIIELADPPVVRFDGKNAVTQSANALKAISPEKTGKRLDLLSPQAVAYGEYLDERLEQFSFKHGTSDWRSPGNPGPLQEPAQRGGAQVDRSAGRAGTWPAGS